MILEDKPEARAEFERVASQMGLRVKVWDDPELMRAECEKFFSDAALISLEHDVDGSPETRSCSGTGLDVAKFLAEKKPVCPVIVHTSNTDRSFSICNELRFADWRVDRVGPIGEKWIEKYWTKKAMEMLAA